MNDKLINQVIQLSSKEEKLGKFGPMMKIKDEKGLTYTVYKTKKDGSVSVAWEQLQSINVGDMTQVSFAEDIGEYEGKSVTYRTVRAFNPDIGNGMTNAAAQGKSPHSEAPTHSQGASRDPHGRLLGVHGIVDGLVANPSFYGPDSGVTHADLVKEAIAIDDEIEKQLNPSKLRQTVQAKAPRVFEEELPVIQQEEDDGFDDLAESIPF